MHISKPVKIASAVIVGLLLTKFAHAQVKTDTVLYSAPKDTSAQAKDTVSTKKDTLSATPASQQDTSKAPAATASAGPDPKQGALLSVSIEPDGSLHVAHATGPDGKDISGTFPIPDELRQIGAKPLMSNELVTIKNKLYLLFEGEDGKWLPKCLYLKLKHNQDIDVMVVDTPKDSPKP